jgi:hypothetical protein
MRYKDIFLIWLWADIIIGLGTLLACLFTKNIANGEFDFALLIVGIGILFSLPSLAIMLIFHAIYSTNSNDKSNYLLPYTLLLLCINLGYYFAGYLYANEINNDFGRGFICFTAFAGILAFYFIDKRIQRRILHQDRIIL